MTTASSSQIALRSQQLSGCQSSLTMSHVKNNEQVTCTPDLTSDCVRLDLHRIATAVFQFDFIRVQSFQAHRASENPGASLRMGHVSFKYLTVMAMAFVGNAISYRPHHSTIRGYRAF